MNRRTLYAVPDPVLAPIECEPWCYDGAGHTDALFAADQWCSQADSEILTAISNGAQIEAHAAHEPGESAKVTLKIAMVNGSATDEAWGHLNASEARRVAAALLLAADNIAGSVLPDVRECVECGAGFQWDESPDDHRCAPCAHAHAAVAG